MDDFSDIKKQEKIDGFLFKLLELSKNKPNGEIILFSPVGEQFFNEKEFIKLIKDGIGLTTDYKNLAFFENPRDGGYGFKHYLEEINEIELKQSEIKDVDFDFDLPF